VINSSSLYRYVAVSSPPYSRVSRIFSGDNLKMLDAIFAGVSRHSFILAG